MKAGHDYVLVARSAAINLPFVRLMDEFRTALRRIADQRKKGAASAPPRRACAGGQGAVTAARPPGAREDK